MLDKLLKMFKKKEESMSSKKKIENLIFILVLLIVTVATINFIWKDDENKDEELNKKENIKLVSNTEETSNSNTLEKRLEDILSNIDGVR